MQNEIQVAAYEGGSLRVLAPDSTAREAVLALPLSRMLVKIVRVPAGTDPVEFATPLLRAACPFPDDPLTVSCETVLEDESGSVVLAAALPEGAAEDIGEALDARKLNVTRVDLLVLGQLRGLWNAIHAGEGRLMLLIKSPDCLSLLVLDGDQPVAIRAIVDGADLRREAMLSLLEAEDFGGRGNLSEIVVVGDVDTSPLADLAPIRSLAVGDDAGLVGVADRANDPTALNALPESWRDVLEEARFKAMLVRRLTVVGAIWLLAVLVLFGVPFVYGFLTDRQKALSRQHRERYREVVAMKEKVLLVRKYSDHARSALKMMKVVSDRLPEGITLTSWTYSRDDGVRLSGEADSATLVYGFKNQMSELAFGEEGEGDPVFPKVSLNGPSAAKGGKQKFDLELGFQAAEEPME